MLQRLRICYNDLNFSGSHIGFGLNSTLQFSLRTWLIPWNKYTEFLSLFFHHSDKNMEDELSKQVKLRLCLSVSASVKYTELKSEEKGNEIQNNLKGLS